MHKIIDDLFGGLVETGFDNDCRFFIVWVFDERFFGRF
jgi:hypothetical protein